MEMEAPQMSCVREQASDRDHLLDRLHNLRAVLPVFAQELVSARRQTARLRVENGRLMEQVRELQRERALDGGLSLNARAPIAQTRSASIGRVTRAR